MMGKQNGQIQIAILDIDSMIPEDHLLRQIKDHVNFDFIYEKAAPYYSNIGRKSIDPVILIKMLLIGYLYGIKSERRLEEEVSLNLAYRWFCGLDLMHRIPDHSTFMQSLLQNGEKITPKQWTAEIQSLQSEYDSIGKEQTKTATELAYAEVINYNKKNLERELQNESRQQNRQQSRTKRRKEEI